MLSAAGQSSRICHTLHQLLEGLSPHSVPYDVSRIPRNGIDVLCEDGEAAHETHRIVRIGTHTGANQLRSRLKQHFLNENKDRSIFRKHIGRCLLHRDNDLFLALWKLDRTTRAAKHASAGKIDLLKQRVVARQVSEYIHSRMQFVAFEILDKAQRLALESKLISTVSLCGQCFPSPDWLGKHSPNDKIRSSGLWQVNELRKTPLSDRELQELRLSLSVGVPP